MEEIISKIRKLKNKLVNKQNYEDAASVREIEREIFENMKKVTIYAHKTDPKAVIPEIAYNSTSACFDITCTETTIIPPGGSAVVPNGLNLTIEEKDSYWMQIQLRSSKGFKYSLIPHYGTVDAGYTGDLGVKIYNVGQKEVIIEEGERYAQIAVIEKPRYEIVELDDEKFGLLKALQGRGDKGFGSSGK